MDSWRLQQTVAFIREDECIGCTRCIQACPVDAILGARQLMHTVITARCIGCDLCIDPCPMDCIDTVAAPPGQAVRMIPVHPVGSERPMAMRNAGTAGKSGRPAGFSRDQAREEIAAAVARVKARKSQTPDKLPGNHGG